MLRTDVKSFYESIDHHLLIERLAVYIKDRFILNLLWQSMSRCVDCGGVFRDIRRGIPRGSPLSPLLGAFFLAELDNCFDHTDVYYVRYMDDVLIMTRTRWSLRRNVARLNRIFNLLKIEKHPDKTFIGRIDKGFDFLGYRFGVELSPSLNPPGIIFEHICIGFTSKSERLPKEPLRLMPM